MLSYRKMINLMDTMFTLHKHMILSSEYNTNSHKLEMTQANVSWWNFYHHKWGIFITHSWPKNILLSVSRFVYTNLYFGSIVTETFMCFSFRICCGNFFFFSWYKYIAHIVESKLALGNIFFVHIYISYIIILLFSMDEVRS